MISMKKHPLLTGTLLLTGTGVLVRFMGFFYRIFLSRTMGAEGMGIYQLVFPVYALFSAVSCAGIQVGISRCCGSALARQEEQRAGLYFFQGLFLATALSLGCSFLLYTQASCISRQILLEPRCASLLKVIAASLPFHGIHSCINAWYYARGKAGVPSFSQFLEQLARVAVSFLVSAILLEQGKSGTPLIAAAGILAGELAGALFSSLAVLMGQRGRSLVKSDALFSSHCFQDLMKISLPLTVNRLILNLLQSGEAVLIPAQLRIFGYSASQALSAYGILTGMALPFILFPGSVTNSLSTLLLPRIAGEQACGNTDGIPELLEKIIHACLLLGILSSGIFFFFGKSLGFLFYKNKDAGIFLQILSFLCPFLYLTTALTGILNGLGHSVLCLCQNGMGILIRLLFVLFAVPRFGLSGYMGGLILSTVAVTGMNLFSLHRKLPYKVHWKDWLLRPAAGIFTGCGCGLAVLYFLRSVLTLTPGLSLLCALFASGCIYLWFLTRDPGIRQFFLKP